MKNYTDIQICKNCLNYSGKLYCKTAKKNQVANMANNCIYFDGELYRYDHQKSFVIGARPSTFSRGN